MKPAKGRYMEEKFASVCRQQCSSIVNVTLKLFNDVLTMCTNVVSQSVTRSTGKGLCEKS